MSAADLVKKLSESGLPQDLTLAIEHFDKVWKGAISSVAKSVTDRVECLMPNETKVKLLE
jgi:hypothetical protein